LAEKYNLQDPYTNLVRTKKEKIRIFLVNGFQVQGKLKSFDNFTYLMEDGKTQSLIFKHATSTILPLTPIKLPPPKSDK